ncbi:MAG: D-glycero-beta-D-manno-heptose 1-phosphate adenylyltransferase [Bacteroidota bacterium]|jgi:D-beta-D-heptose 7-phosphate kinase/D-beta-D-heptose 1-phosphate adenosyltransferase
MDNWYALQQKIQPVETLRQTLASWRRENLRVVFTNGCFDLIHPGHVRYLAQARDLGDKLVVGINGDASVRRLKGENRPLLPASARSVVLAGLAFVDAITSFDEDTPLELIRMVRPSVLVKGGDWALHQIVGAAEVKAYGGLVQSLPFLDGFSTSSLEHKMKEADMKINQFLRS